MKFFNVTWPGGRRDHLKGTSIGHALDNAGYGTKCQEVLANWQEEQQPELFTSTSDALTGGVVHCFWFLLLVNFIPSEPVDHWWPGMLAFFSLYFLGMTCFAYYKFVKNYKSTGYQEVLELLNSLDLRS